MSSLGRSRVIVASSSEVMLQSLWRVVGVLCQGLRDEFEFPPREAFESPPDYRDNAVLAAGPEAIAAFLDDIPAETIRRTVCILDLSSEPTPVWRVIRDMHTLRPTWLAARYPEVYWIFIVRDGAVPKDIAADAQRMHFVALDELSRLPELLSRHAGGFRPWFDPCGLRASALLLSAECHASCLNIGLRGLVFDEETTYAAFNGYFLYRQGIPTRIIATAGEFNMVKVLHDAKREYVILEDVELNYEDVRQSYSGGNADSLFLATSPVGIQRLFDKRRDDWNIREDQIKARVFVSSSRVSDMPSVVKPFGGLYDRNLLSFLPTRSAATGYVTAPGYITTHSAPGAQQAVAAKLLARVSAYRTSANDTVSAVHVALLALEAERLLANNTYTMAIDALAARHTLEVVAESAFAGAADNLEVRKRIADLKTEMYKLVFHCENGWKVIASLLPHRQGWRDNWRKLRKRCVQFSNGMLECVGQLRETYQRFSKVDEEEEALEKIRWWQLASFLVKRSDLETWASDKASSCYCLFTRLLLQLVGKLVYIPRLGGGLIWAYFNWVMNPLVLFFVITCWVLLFGLLFNQVVLSGGFDKTYPLTVFDWIRHSLVTFVALQQGIMGDPKLADPEFTKFTKEGCEAFTSFWNLTALEMVLGYLHLPVFITLLIQKFTRR